jgi:peptide chain release factor 1
MYTRFAERERWKVDVISMTAAGQGGIKEVIAMVEGERVYSKLRYESGVHRVQRVPATEASGRIHTSAITVAVLPEARSRRQDRGQGPAHRHLLLVGPGGQSVNTTYSACASPTCPRTPSCPARTRRARSRTARRP